MCKALTPFAGVRHISISIPSSMRIMRAQFLQKYGLRKLLRSMVGEVCEVRGSAEFSRYRRGRLFSTVAAASDGAESIRRTGKRVPKRERKIMVESFVNKYRILNAGKFPSVSVAQKEVGGNYYVIREILQDLEYNLVHNPGVGIAGNSVEKKGAEKKYVPEWEILQAEEVSCSNSRVENHLREVEKVPHSEEKVFSKDKQDLNDNIEIKVGKTVESEVKRGSTGSEQVRDPPLSMDLARDVSIDQRIMCEEVGRVSFIEHANNLSNDGIKKHSESRQTLDMASFSEKTFLEDTLNPRIQEDKDELRSNSLQAEGWSSMPHTGESVLVDERDAKSCKGFVKPNISTSNLTDYQKTPTYDGTRETSTENSNDNKKQENPSIWTHLKSFADSIFSIWRQR